jgi:hypothetical protein
MRSSAAIFASSCLAIAALGGAAEAVRLSTGLAKFGGHEYVGRILALSAVREAGPTVSATAALLALVWWAHHREHDLVRRLRWRAVAGAAVVSAVAAVPSAAVWFGSGVAVAFGIAGDPGARVALDVLRPADALGAAWTWLVTWLALAPMATLLLPRVAEPKLHLAAKLIAAGGVVAAVRIVVALLAGGAAE